MCINDSFFKYFNFITDNRCAYKGKSYSPGQKWYDGCDYECVCQDGATGRYQCYNRFVFYDCL